MTSPKRRDPQGRWRAPRPYEAVVDHLRAKDTAAAARIGLVHPSSPSSPSDPEQAEIDRALRQCGLGYHQT